jgi:hypothetical protein
MSKLKAVWMILIGLVSIVMAPVAYYELTEFWARVIMLSGTLAGGFAMFLIVFTEYKTK